MRKLLIACAAALTAWTAPAAAAVRVDGGGFVQNVFTGNGGMTTLASNTGFVIGFGFDPADLTLVGSNADAAGYRFTVTGLTARIGDYQFHPLNGIGTLTFARAFSFFEGPASERVLIQTFAFSGTATGAPFSLPNGVTRTSLALTSIFRYGNALPPIDATALNDPALAARGSFSFAAVPVSGTARASVGGPAGASFAAAAVPEPSSWALVIVGFGAAGAMLRRPRRSMIPQTT